MPHESWRPMRRVVGRTVLAVVVPALVACGGGTSAPSATEAAASPSPASTTAATASAAISPSAAVSPSTKPMESPMTFSLSSTAFAEGGRIPRKFSCDGENVSPALSWNDAPDGTASFALVVDDPDARGFAHWIVFNMTGSQSGSLPEAVSAGTDAPPQGTNDFGRIGWGGPCPPSGTHHYRFTIYALDNVLDIADAPRIDALRRALDGHVLDQAVLQATYTRGG